MKQIHLAEDTKFFFWGGKLAKRAINLGFHKTQEKFVHSWKIITYLRMTPLDGIGWLDGWLAGRPAGRPVGQSVGGLVTSKFLEKFSWDFWKIFTALA